MEATLMIEVARCVVFCGAYQKGILHIMGVLILAFIMAWGSSSNAHATDVSVLGAMTVSNASFESGATYGSGGTAGVNFGGGATLGLDLTPFFAFETGVLYLKHSLSNGSNYTTQDLTMNYVTIPWVIRFSPISLIAVSGGAYYGIGTGNTVERTTPPYITVVSEPSGRNEWGLLAAVGARVPLLSMMKLRVDLVYQWGLTNLNLISETQKSRNFNVLAGVMFDIW